MTDPYGANPPMPPLLNPDDYSTFAEIDSGWFLAAAGAAIRRFCDWHIYPSLTESKYSLMGGDGTVILRSGHVTGVTSITLPVNSQVIDPSCYFLDPMSSVVHFVRPAGALNSSGWWAVPFGGTNAYPKYFRHVWVEMTHGYDELPPEVAEVAYELVMRAMEKPAGVANKVQAGPYRFEFDPFGLILSEDQKCRLSPYKLPGIT